MKRLLRAFVPEPLIGAYHWSLAYVGAFLYGFPSRTLFVIGITGTKGKSTTAELVRAILAADGKTVALASTIRFAIGSKSEPNHYKMTMPGRFVLQKFLRDAVNAGATHAVIEITSEGAKQFRHKGISLDALIFTNLAPEHLESHGGFEQYLRAKLSVVEHLARSAKRPRYMIANADDAHGKDFLAMPVEVKVPFSRSDAEPYRVDDRSIRFVWKRKDLFTVPLPGLFNLDNVLAATALGETLGIAVPVMQGALAHIAPIAGRAERIEGGQSFTVIVDYAHTPDSLRALYETFKGQPLVCVLGATGGGRDRWKRPEMGKTADTYCHLSFLTNDDPYDEDPQSILTDIAKGFTRTKPQLIIDRRVAIREALKAAKEGEAVLITGKGTDPFLMGPRGSKEPWSDRKVAEEELQKLGYH